MKIFISYVREDLEDAMEIYSDLQKYCITPWLDEKTLPPGVRYAQYITEKMKESECIVFLISSNFVNKLVKKDKFISKELELALALNLEDKKTIIPVRLEECDLPTQLAQLHWVDVFSPLREEGLRKVLRFLKTRGAHFKETFSSIGEPDNEGWNIPEEWDLVEDSHTECGSKSMYSNAKGNITKRTASIELKLGHVTTLQYYRKLKLYTGGLPLGNDNASFEVIIDDGSEHIIDKQEKDYNESSWTERCIDDISIYSGKTVTLKFVVSIDHGMHLMSSAEAWIDDITIPVTV